jgi:hydroxymethylbilane synthase
MTTTTSTLRLGTRRSALALAQSTTVADSVRRLGHVVEMVEVVTEGDRSTTAIATMGGTGVFVTELRRQLLDGTIDFAVHSLKDLPTQSADGLVVAALPRREDPRDALVSRGDVTLAELASGSRVGTGSPRRTAQLRALGLGLEVVAIRGNVDTRLRRVGEGDLDAVIVAAAGLARLGRLEAVAEVLDPGQMLPAPGQGALAIECRADDDTVRAVLSALDDPATRASTAAERTLLARLEAGCTAPVGALADVAVGDDGDEIYLRAVVASTDGSAAIRLSATGPFTEPEGLGRRLAEDLLDAGAAGLIGENP